MLHSDAMDPTLHQPRNIKKLHHDFKTELRKSYPHVFKHHSFNNPVRALATCINWSPYHTQSDSPLQHRINVANSLIRSDTKTVFMYVGDTVAADDQETRIEDNQHIYQIVCDRFEVIPYIDNDEGAPKHLPISTMNIMADAHSDCFIAVTPEATVSTLFFSSNEAWEHKTIDNILDILIFKHMARSTMTDYQMLVYDDRVHHPMVIVMALQSETHKLYCFARFIDSMFDTDVQGTFPKFNFTEMIRDDGGDGDNGNEAEAEEEEEDDEEENSSEYDEDPENVKPSTVFEFISQSRALEPGFMAFQKDDVIMFVYQSKAAGTPIVIKELRIESIESNYNADTVGPLLMPSHRMFGCVRAMNAMRFHKKLCQLVCGFLFIVDPLTGFIFRGEFQPDGVFWTEHRDLIRPNFKPADSNVFAVSNINGKLVVVEEKKHSYVFEHNTVITTHYLTVIPTDVAVTYDEVFIHSHTTDAIIDAFKARLLEIFVASVKQIPNLRRRILDEHGNIKPEVLNDPEGENEDSGAWCSDLELRINIAVKRFIDDDALTVSTITVDASYYTPEYSTVFTATANADIERVLGFNLPQYPSNYEVSEENGARHMIYITIIAAEEGVPQRCSLEFENVEGEPFVADLV